MSTPYVSSSLRMLTNKVLLLTECPQTYSELHEELGDGSADEAQIWCKMCTGGPRMELECQSCLQTLDMQRFSKTQQKDENHAVYLQLISSYLRSEVLLLTLSYQICFGCMKLRIEWMPPYVPAGSAYQPSEEDLKWSSPVPALSCGVCRCR